jgi:hypothetical protein
VNDLPEESPGFQAVTSGPWGSFPLTLALPIPKVFCNLLPNPEENKLQTVPNSESPDLSIQLYFCCVYRERNVERDRCRAFLHGKRFKYFQIFDKTVVRKFPRKGARKKIEPVTILQEHSGGMAHEKANAGANSVFIHLCCNFGQFCRR